MGGLQLSLALLCAIPTHTGSGGHPTLQVPEPTVSKKKGLCSSCWWVKWLSGSALVPLMYD